MKSRATEKEILQKATEALERTVEIETEIHTDIDPMGPDAVIRILWEDMEWKFAAEVKHTLTRATVGATVQQLKRHFEKGLVVTRYVTPQIAEILKEMDVQFLDAAGNAYLNEPPLFVFIKGNKPIEIWKEKLPTRAFRPTGLQAVFALLCNPGLEKAQYREIAKTANVALGTIGWVMGDLRRTGHLVEMGRRDRRLVNKKKLLDRWVEMYPERLRPKVLIGKYRTEKIDWWKREDLTNLNCYWGGEVAAAKITKYLKPQVVTIYAKGRPERLFVAHRLKKAKDGNVELLKTFWNFEGLKSNHYRRYLDLVHPILVYADLLASGDERNIETARIIYEREITGLIRED